MSAVKTRHVCYNTADALINVLVRLQQRYKPARRKLQLDNSVTTTKDSLDTICSVNVNAGGAETPEKNSQSDAADVEL